MAKIAYILLCHKDPDAIIKQANRLTATGDHICIHFDARAIPAHFRRLQEALGSNPDVAFAEKRVKCGWGEWSLVEATLNAVQTAVKQFSRASHFYMLSGDCMVIKSSEYIHSFLDENDVDFIESFDFFESNWIKTGMKDERLIYRHWFNERTQKRRFYAAYNLQKSLGLKRDVPADLQIMIGSQWWCLRRQTVEALLDFAKSRRDVMRFFRTTWIPDETFFQTLVRHLVPDNEIRSRTLTFLMFTDYGMPLTFYNDHYDLLISQDYLFARKISPEATELKERLGQLYAEEGVEFQISAEGPNLFRFLTESGRNGKRFASRFWETENTLGRDRELMIVVCKKWHVAKRLLDKINQHTDLPTIAYLFDEESTPLPDLGGTQSSLDKRARHRRALMRMLFEYYDSNRMLICLDPSAFDLIEDFASDRCTTRVLEIQCDFSNQYLTGHAIRIGLAGENASEETLDHLLPTIRRDIFFESDRILDAGLKGLSRMVEGGSEEAHARALSAFLQVSEDTAREIAHEPHLFSD
jgi:hypothetical protein